MRRQPGHKHARGSARMQDKRRASTNGERGGSGERMSLSWWSSSWAPRQAPRRWQRRGAGKSPCLGSSPCPCGRTAPTPFFFRRLRGQGGEHTVKQRRPRQRSERTSGLEPDLAGDSWQVPHRAERGWPAPLASQYSHDTRRAASAPTYPCMLDNARQLLSSRPQRRPRTKIKKHTTLLHLSLGRPPAHPAAAAQADTTTCGGCCS